MNRLFDYLNLKPSERRLMMFMLIVLFALLNYWFVFPQFRERREVKTELKDKELRLLEFQAQASRVPDLQLELAQVEASIGTNTLVGVSANQTSDFARRVDQMQEETGLQITLRSKIVEAQFGIKTNQFFTDLTMSINYQSPEDELVDFIYKISSGDSKIRVSDLIIRPVANQMLLEGSITLISSFRKDSDETPETAVSRP